MRRSYAVRRSIGVLIVLLFIVTGIIKNPDFYQAEVKNSSVSSGQSSGEAMTALSNLVVKGRAPKTGYTRERFGNGWQTINGCDTRNIILGRDLKNTVINSKCQVVTGVLADPYTGRSIQFERGEASSQAVQIDHVVALSDAWQKGAQVLTKEARTALANDPLELLAVDGTANQEKGDGDAATWLPAYKPFRCQYIARQIAVKAKYHLWVTAAEKDAMIRILSACPGQPLPSTT